MTQRLTSSACAISSILLLAAPGCYPDGATGWEGDGTGTGQETGTETAGEGDAESKCVEIGGVISCWTLQGEAWAQVFLPCQVTESVGAGLLGDAYLIEALHWGAVECHDVLLSDSTFCLYGEESIVLLGNGQGAWEPYISSTPDGLAAVEPPC